MKEVDAARALLRESQAFASMKKERPDRYMKLEHMLQRNSFEASEVSWQSQDLLQDSDLNFVGVVQAYGAAGGRDKRRQQVANGKHILALFQSIVA